MKNKLYRSIGISVSSSYIFFAINFLGQLVLVRLLRPEDFGVFALVMSISAMIDLFVSFSIPMAYIKERETESLFKSACFLSLVVGFLPLLVSSVAYFPLSHHYDPKIAQYLLIVTLTKPFFSLSAIMIASVEKKAQFGKSYLLAGLSMSSSLVIAISLAYLGFDEISLIVREVLRGVILFFIVKAYLRIPLSFSFDKSEIKRLLSFSSKMILSRGSEVGYFKIPFLLIGSTFGTVTLGYFSQAFYLVSLVSTALNPITEKVAFVFYSQMERSKHNFRTINIIILSISFPISIALFTFPGEIISTIYGDKWLESSEYVRYLAIFGFVLPFFNNHKSFLYSEGLNNIVTVAYLFSLCLLIYLLHIDLLVYAYPASIAFGLFIFFLVKIYKNPTNTGDGKG
ncbi:oligosaccharide flippase family protein [Vibrio caribbeanicus]|uniref:oligosaccharide flippase family protein n=1 Tax=Vibrio caribbeanicus TaxID=701175 RepID=UPI0030DA32AE